MTGHAGDCQVPVAGWALPACISVPASQVIRGLLELTRLVLPGAKNRSAASGDRLAPPSGQALSACTNLGVQHVPRIQGLTNGLKHADRSTDVVG